MRPIFGIDKDFLRIHRSGFPITLKDLYNITMISGPEKLNSTEFEDCMDLCLNLEYFICNDLRTLSNPDETCCEPVFEGEIEESCEILQDGRMKCENVPKHILIKIFHKFAKGLEKVQVFFEILHNTEPFYVGTKIDRIFEVKYMVVKNQQGINKELSGNPGYLTGRPVISGKFVEVVHNNTNDFPTIQYVIDYFHENSRYFNTRNILTAPANVRGLCKLSNTTYESIIFGVNLRTKCDLKLGKLEITKTTNLAQMCTNIQKKIFFTLFGNKDRLNNFVSVFGKPRNLTSEWLKLVHHKTTNNNINGYTKRRNLICQNLVYYISYYFVYLNLDFRHLHQQSRILRAGVKYGEQVDVKINLDDPKVTVGVEVLFKDITHSKELESLVEIKQSEYLVYPFSFWKSSNDASSQFNKSCCSVAMFMIIFYWFICFVKM